MFAINSKNFLAHSAFSLRLSTINLFNFIEPPGAFYEFSNIYSKKQWHQKCIWLNQYIENYQPDIIAFQEVFSVSALKRLLELLGYRFFSVVDEPKPITRDVYNSPVVSLASRYPILRALPLRAYPELSIQLGMTKDFEYSRLPLFATLELPYIGQTDMYVVHLKSKRPTIYDTIYEKNKLLYNSIFSKMSGSWASSIQRGSEAYHLMTYIFTRRFHTNNPVIMMGDFNDDINSHVLSAFHMSSLHLITEDIPLSHYSMHDSWDLYVKNTEETGLKRPDTYYAHAQGSVLDYILLSNEFDGSDPASIADVGDFHCENKHLIKSKFTKDIYSSDHAIISVTISLRQ
ncbi:endonuclease/exonuclease/phosphatase family protein [Candidatus Enterovibrio altilux]|uniref:Endonuclease/exonuclease/phosphatase family protein n=1 Tax=Candidatus Enterovibrio altilux TaxID=1927128 RepID=A0A291BAN9_9GAMM|nr:endonuclease/exonuclease/phosphatase family protein [Candidatus Enterovibrio luxaltus]ATF10051.1 Endonuclease/exonuclease/phosphatase family protein [Candidatus Enterovibrio luxaltus]